MAGTVELSRLLTDASKILQQAKVENPELDAELLLQHVTGFTRTHIFLYPEQEITRQQQDTFNDCLKKRCQRIPLHYITGSREFWSLDFHVCPDVLIPRPETEFLLSHLFATCPALASDAYVLDMCTGSGIIAIVCAKELGCKTLGVDLSQNALAIAQKNIDRHSLQNRVSLICSNLFTALRRQRQYDVIVSNPPYIVDDQILRLDPEVAAHEPRMALAGGADGLDFVRDIAKSTPDFLTPGGHLFVEIGADQGQAVSEIFSAKAAYINIQIVEDWSGRPRVLQAQVT